MVHYNKEVCLCVNMADSELEDIRAKRLAELQSQYGMKVRAGSITH